MFALSRRLFIPVCAAAALLAALILRNSPNYALGTVNGAASTSSAAAPSPPVALAIAGTATLGTDCGTVRERGPNPPTDPAALQAEDCFLAAFQACQPATLTVASQGVDVGGTTTFAVTLDGSGGCSVQGTYVTVFVPNRQSTTSFSCDGVVMAQDGGLLIQSCGEYGDIPIPSPASNTTSGS